MAESVFRGLVEEEELDDRMEVDSAGTSDYHIGEPSDPRTLDVVRKYRLTGDHRGRQFTVADFTDFDYILAMDRSNLSNIKRLLPAGTSDDRIFLMRDFDDQQPGAEVPDPYWSEADGFEEVYRMLLRSSKNLLSYLKEQHPELAR